MEVNWFPDVIEVNMVQRSNTAVNWLPKSLDDTRFPSKSKFVIGYLTSSKSSLNWSHLVVLNESFREMVEAVDENLGLRVFGLSELVGTMDCNLEIYVFGPSELVETL
ncbi:hypothetical protein Bhyg_02797, partial [Pseudolycoriella hygida]